MYSVNLASSEQSRIHNDVAENLFCPYLFVSHLLGTDFAQ